MCRFITRVQGTDKPVAPLNARRFGSLMAAFHTCSRAFVPRAHLGLYRRAWMTSASVTTACATAHDRRQDTTRHIWVRDFAKGIIAQWETIQLCALQAKAVTHMSDSFCKTYHSDSHPLEISHWIQKECKNCSQREAPLEKAVKQIPLSHYADVREKVSRIGRHQQDPWRLVIDCVRWCESYFRRTKCLGGSMMGSKQHVCAFFKISLSGVTTLKIRQGIYNKVQKCWQCKGYSWFGRPPRIERKNADNVRDMSDMWMRACWVPSFWTLWHASKKKA